MHELNSIAAEMESLLPLFQNGGGLVGQFLNSADTAHFDELLAEAKYLIDTELGHPNNYSVALTYIPLGRTNSPSPLTVQNVAKTLRRAARTLSRAVQSHTQPRTFSRTYVDPTRLSALESLESKQWDFTRLIELCREINVAAASQCHFSTVMLLRTILNHVPPIFGFQSFTAVASNYGGPQNRSFKANMVRLENSSRKIADQHLHSMIRSSEDIPTFVQVDFSADLDVLLGEIIRITKPQKF